MISCTAKKHVFDGDSRKCLCGKADKYWFDCGRCKIGGVAKYKSLPCSDCLNDPEYKKEQRKDNKKFKRTLSYGKYVEPTAFGYDKKTGQPLALDRKGRKIDPGRTRYDLERDPHGWAATGKIPKKKKYYI